MLRRHKDVLLSKDVNFFMVSETLKILPISIFENDKHNFEEEPLYDHRHRLIYLIVQNYLDKRLKHENEKMCDLKNRIRMHYTKTTIFKGE